MPIPLLASNMPPSNLKWFFFINGILGMCFCLPGERTFVTMWKPATPSYPSSPEPQRAPVIPVQCAAAIAEPVPAAAPRNAMISNQEQATIGKSLVIKGEVSGSEALFIDGRVDGSINLPGYRVTIGRNGEVAANIIASDIVVMGKVRGNLSATDRVDIRSEGSLAGDVSTQRISIEDGAYFKGGIDLRKAGAPGNGVAKQVKSEVRQEAAVHVSAPASA